MTADHGGVRKPRRKVREIEDEISAVEQEYAEAKKTLATDFNAKLDKLEARKKDAAGEMHLRLLRAAAEAGVTIDIEDLDHDKLVRVLREIGEPFQRAAAAEVAAPLAQGPTAKKAARHDG